MVTTLTLRRKCRTAMVHFCLQSCCFLNSRSRVFFPLQENVLHSSILFSRPKVASLYRFCQCEVGMCTRNNDAMSIFLGC
jgi:hypothetical protein